MTDRVIRRARPEDADFLATVILSATRSHLPRGFFDLLVPDDALRLDVIRALLVSEKPSWWHASLFWIAERDGRPGAALSGFDPKRLAPPDGAITEAVATCGLDAKALAAAFANCEPMFECFLDPAPGAWVVESVATDPGARGGGLASALVAHVLAEGRDAGHEVAQLALFIGNAPAQRVYERHGFAITQEKRSPRFEAVLGGPGIAQMTARLR